MGVNWFIFLEEWTNVYLCKSIQHSGTVATPLCGRVVKLILSLTAARKVGLSLDFISEGCMEPIFSLNKS